MNTLKELYLEAARVAELIEGTELTMGECWKYDGGVFNKHDVVSFRAELSRYEACLAIVKGKPVFKGDELYDERGNRYPIQTYDLDNGVSYLNKWNIKNWSWNPPLPKTVMVELLVKDAEFMVSAYGVEAKFKSATSEVAEACRKALEGLKS